VHDLELELMKRFACRADGFAIEVAERVTANAVMGALVYALLWLLVVRRPERRALAGRVLLAAALGIGALHAVREVFWTFLPRERPGQELAREHRLMNMAERETCASRPDALAVRSHVPKGASFPSSHTVTAGGAAAAIFFAARGIGIIAWLYALLVGVGRVWLAKHWPSDVLGSLLLSGVVGWGAWHAAGGVVARIRRRRGGAPETVGGRG